jgi:hypothetical protein
MPPRPLGYFPYVPVGRTINMSELDKELRARNVAFELTLKVTKKCDLLKRDEARRQEAKLQLLRQGITENEETINSEYKVDLSR